MTDKVLDLLGSGKTIKKFRKICDKFSIVYCMRNSKCRIEIANYEEVS